MKKERKVKIYVENYNRTVEANIGSNLGEVLSNEGLIDLPCGGRGLCGSCIVRVEGKVSPPTGNELIRRLNKGLRLACQTKVLGDVRVKVLLRHAPPVSLKSLLVPIPKLDPLVRVYQLSHLPTTTYPELINLASIHIERRQPMLSAGRNDSLIGFSYAGLTALTRRPPEGTKILLVDLGTTKIAYQAIDLKGTILKEGVILNPQETFGADVMTRLSKALEDVKFYKKLVSLVRIKVTDLLKEIEGDVCVLAGNSTMELLFLGLPVDTLAVKPYQPLLKGPFLDQLEGKFPCFVAPLISGHVGGDSFMNLVASEGLGTELPYMIVDIGTNTEVLLVRKEENEKKLIVASAPAGPAFEGHLISGVPASSGGFTKVRIKGFDKDHPLFEAKGKGPGLTGSGIVSLVAELIRNKLVEPSGKIIKGFTTTAFGKGYIIESGELPTLFTQKDMREFQKALSAVRTSWELVLKRANLKPRDLKKLFISGNFGSELDIEDALLLRLIPSIEKERIVIGGNMVLSGLRVSALNRYLFWKVWSLAEGARHIELAEDPDFSKIWIKNLIL